MTKNEAIARLGACAASIRARGGVALFLFGSTATGDARTASDLDLFLDYDKNSAFNALDLVAIKRELELSLGHSIDLTTRDGLHPLIKEHVESEAIRIF